MRFRKKPPSPLTMAIKYWNKAAKDNPRLPQTRRKDDERHDMANRLVHALGHLNWQDKETWKQYFQAVSQKAELIEQSVGSDNFRVTLEWALRPANAKRVLNRD